MTFEWDEAKNRANIRKHGFDFADAEEMFRGPLLVRPDTREDYGEKIDWYRDDPGQNRLCGLRRGVGRDDPHHLTEKGRS